jgi:hypothetical protein
MNMKKKIYKKLKKGVSQQVRNNILYIKNTRHIKKSNKKEIKK